jgi:hypothetical protein
MKALTAHGIVVMVCGTAILSLAAMFASWSGPVGPDFWFWCGACLVGELLWIRLPMGQATTSLASCMHFAALLLLTRGQAMVIVALTGVVAETLFLRKPPLRVLFNASQATLAVGAASLAYRALGGGGSEVSTLLYDFRLLPFAAAAVAYFVINTGSVSCAVGLSEGCSPWAAWRRNFGTRHDLLSCGAIMSLGALLASHYALAGPTGTLLVVLPLLFAHEAYRIVMRRRLDPADREAERDAA